MARRLIINADDFGLTHGINRAVAELHDAGVLTSTTLMAAGPAFDDAVRIARARPCLGVGCHIILTDGTPLSPPRTIASLLARNSKTFRPKLIPFLAALLTGQIASDEIEREAVAQIERLQQAGIRVTHLDTHKHTHIFPMVTNALLRAATRTGVKAVRNPFEQPWSFRLASGTRARSSQVRLIQLVKRRFSAQPALRSGQIRTTDGTIGVSATGSLDELTLRNLLAALPDGTWELVCHPGYNDADLANITTRLRETRDIERRALLAVLDGSQGEHASQSASCPVTGPTSPAGPGQSSSSSSQPSRPELIHYGSLS